MLMLAIVFWLSLCSTFCQDINAEPPEGEEFDRSGLITAFNELVTTSVPEPTRENQLTVRLKLLLILLNIIYYLLLLLILLVVLLSLLLLLFNVMLLYYFKYFT